jgi:hypothetical protein
MEFVESGPSMISAGFAGYWQVPVDASHVMLQHWKSLSQAVPWDLQQLGMPRIDVPHS